MRIFPIKFYTLRKIETEARPGWAEIVIGLLILILVIYLVTSNIKQIDLSPAARGLILAALSGVAGLCGFAAAAGLRIRSLEAFGIRRVSGWWLLTGAGAGLVAFFLKVALLLMLTDLLGSSKNVQDIYLKSANGGPVFLVLTAIFLCLITPLGEEFLFRGVVTNALLKYGSFTAVVVSAVIFALFHGINIIFPAALIAGLAAGEIFRRSGSIWPAVILHAVFNLATLPLLFFST